MNKITDNLIAEQIEYFNKYLQDVKDMWNKKINNR